MKIQVGPSASAWVRNKPAASPATAALPPPLPSDLDLSRQLHFANASEVDEAAVALVELSVLVYSPLYAIRQTFERFGNGLRPAAFSAGVDRAADWDWVERHCAAIAFSTRLWGHTPKPPTPVSAHPLPIWLQPPARPSFPLPQADKNPGRPLTPGALLFKGAGIALPPRPPPVPAAPPASSIPAPPCPAAPVAGQGTSPPDSAPKRTWAAPDEIDRRNDPPRVLAVLHGKTALVVFRGTDRVTDWLRNISCWPALRWPLRHWGFETTWRGVRPQVEAWLEETTRTLGAPPTLYLGGHSLGGALATLAATDLAAHYPIARVVTVGSPRVGGWLFRRAYRRTPAAPGLDGKPRPLPAVTTRWVHGSDIVTLLPPPLLAAHVVPSEALHATDRLPLEEFFPAGLMDPAPLLGLITRDAQLGVSHGLAPSMHPAWHSQARQVIGQSMFWLAMAVPSMGWTRLFLPLLPAALAQTLRSSFHHKSMRYLGFMPATALFRAMFPPRSAPVPPDTPEPR